MLLNTTLNGMSIDQITLGLIARLKEQAGIPVSYTHLYGRGIPTAEESEQFGYDGPLFYDPDFENPDYMLYNPDALWGIAKAPFGGNNMASAGEPADFIPESMKPYIGNAISFCFGDEGGYSTSEAEAFGKWFDWTREHYQMCIRDRIWDA